jgi:hypothetical protein
MPGGRPTDYDPKYCEEIIQYFDQTPYEIVSDDKGRSIVNPRPLPTKERFAHSIGVHKDTLVEWSKVHPEFSAAYKKATQLQCEALSNGGLMGAYDKTMAIFLLKNNHGMADKVEQKVTTTTEEMSDEELNRRIAAIVNK